MKKLITMMITLLFCWSLKAQSTIKQSTHPIQFALEQTDKTIILSNLETLNTVFHEYCPLAFQDGVLFTTDRVDRLDKKNSDANFYYATQKNNFEFAKPEVLKNELNSNLQEGIATVSPDGLTVIFSRDEKNVKKANGFTDVRLYESSFEKGKWTKPKKMTVNSKGYSSGHPALSRDGETLYFVSNRPGGHGGSDIYFSKKNKKGKWSKAKNLGRNVNSPKNEFFPFIDDLGILYFSSSRSSGLGKLDILIAKQNADGVFAKAINPGSPINSERNDFGFSISKDGTYGYLSSDREGGKGGNDIYVVKVQSEEALELTEMKLVDYENHAPIANASVRMKDENENTFQWYSDENGVIEVDGSRENINLLTVEHPSYMTTLFDPKMEQGEMVIIEMKKHACVMLSGQIMNTDGSPLKLENVKLTVTNISSDQESEILSNAEGAFEYCMECNNNFSIKTSPEGYYFEAVFVSTKDINCSKQQGIKTEMTLVKMLEEEFPNENPNAENFVAPVESAEQTTRNEKNKAMLESISVAEEEVEEKEIEEVETYKVKEKKEIRTEFALPQIYYNFNKYELDEVAKKHIGDVAEFLKDNPSKNLTIHSYTDTKGKSAYNKWLSKRRAEKVMAHLLEFGIEKVRMKAIGEGEIKELDSSISRRTEFKIEETAVKEETEAFSIAASKVSAIEETYVSKIYYGFDSYLINETSKIEVDNLVTRLKEDEHLIVEIKSHTDSRGSKNYNLKLSQKRAEEVKRIIISKGIDSARLEAKGYGETELINECADGVRCAKSAHMENRRTEFVFGRN